jgi:hypothetical protein
METSGATAHGGKDQLRPSKRGKVQHLEAREQESRWLGATCSSVRVSDKSSKQKQTVRQDLKPVRAKSTSAAAGTSKSTRDSGDGKT